MRRGHIFRPFSTGTKQHRAYSSNSDSNAAMAERDALQKRYAYNEMSNKVTQADRSARRGRGGDGSTGEVETLRGRTDIGRMGDAIGGGGGSKAGSGDATPGIDTGRNEASREIEEIREKANKRRMKREKASGGGGADPPGQGKRRRAGIDWAGVGTGTSILDMGEISGYRPTTVGARSNYESLLVSR